jgi:hypothetical protein
VKTFSGNGRSGDTCSALIVRPLARVVHELLINAAVRSVPNRGPSESIGKRCEDKAAATSVARIRRPAPSHDHQPGFDPAMIGAMIEKQLLGELGPDWSDDGLVVDILVPP